MNSFNWNIEKWLLRYRKGLSSLEVLFKFLEVLLTPVKNLHAELLSLKTAFDLRMRYNSQQMSYAAVLNKIFDPVQKRIRVITGSDSLPVNFTYYKSEVRTPRYTYFKSELEPPIFTYFHDEKDNDGLILFFIPISLMAEEPRIIAWIKYYKLADKKFQIIYE